MGLVQPLTQLAANSTRSRCIARMIHVFVHLGKQFLPRDERVNRLTLHVKDNDWFWDLAAKSFNDADDSDINFHFFVHADAKTEEFG